MAELPEAPSDDEPHIVCKSLANSHRHGEVEATATARMANSHSRDRPQEMQERAEGSFLRTSEDPIHLIGRGNELHGPKEYCSLVRCTFQF